MKKVFVMVLAAALVLSLAACGAKSAGEPNEGGSSTLVTLKDGDTVGDGKTALSVAITGKDGSTIHVIVNTDEKTVGEALQNIGLMDGEEGPYGIYIKSVNGEVADYDTDGTYWAFYINGEYAAAGADQTAVDASAEYGFVAEKMS